LDEELMLLDEMLKEYPKTRLQNKTLLSKSTKKPFKTNNRLVVKRDSSLL
jgi:hypothetical protein